MNCSENVFVKKQYILILNDSLADWNGSLGMLGSDNFRHPRSFSMVSWKSEGNHCFEKMGAFGWCVSSNQEALPIAITMLWEAMWNWVM